MLIVDTDVSLSGYVNHIEFKHDGITVWCIADCDPTVKLLYWDYSINKWLDVFDLLRDHKLPEGQKVALGHTMEFGAVNIHLGIAYKDTRYTPARGGFHHLIINKATAIAEAKARK